MASSSSFSSLPLDSPSFPLTPLAHPPPSASTSSHETASSSPRIPVSSYPALPSSGPSTPSISPPPTTSFPGYTPLNDPPLPKSSKAKGKAREVQQKDGWIDLERGGQGQGQGQHGGPGGGQQLDSTRGEEDAEGDHMVRSGWERIKELTIHEGGEQEQEQGRSYPPMTEDEREEKRIADTLALWKERDLAKRRAARESKQLKSSSGGGSRSSGSLSSMPSMRLPGGGGGPSKRWSIWSGGESPNPSPPHNATTFLPTSSSSNNTTSNTTVPTSFSSSSSPSPSTFQPGHQPNMSTASTADYEYRGREWMGGATQAPRRRRAEIGFWENLCGTGRNDRAPGENIEDGSDEDDGDQAGRTNPFE